MLYQSTSNMQALNWIVLRFETLEVEINCIIFLLFTRHETIHWQVFLTIFFCLAIFSIVSRFKVSKRFKAKHVTYPMIKIMSGSRAGIFLLVFSWLKCEMLTRAKIPLHWKNGLFWNLLRWLFLSFFTAEITANSS